jgi:hypothetical protein
MFYLQMTIFHFFRNLDHCASLLQWRAEKRKMEQEKGATSARESIMANLVSIL